jgi:hypothetical protein
MREMPTGTSADVTDARRAAILEAEARRLAHTVTRFGVLTRGRLAELSSARLWSRGRFNRALELAEQHGLITHLGYGFYAPGSDSATPDERRRRQRSDGSR